MSYNMRYLYASSGCLPDNHDFDEDEFFEDLASLKLAMIEAINMYFDDFDSDNEYEQYLNDIRAEISKAESLDDLPLFFEQNRGEYDLYHLKFEIEEILPPQVGDTLPVSKLSDNIYYVVSGDDVPDVTEIRDFLGRDYRLLYRHYFVKSVNGEYAEVWGSDSLELTAGADCLYIAPPHTLPPCDNDMYYILWYLGNEKPYRVETGFSHKLGYNRVTYWYKFEAGYFGFRHPLWISLEIQDNGMVELKFWQSRFNCVWRMVLERNGEFHSYAPYYHNPNDI